MRRLLVAAVLAFAATAGSVAIVQASCAAPPGFGPTTLAAQLKAAPIVFVGTVIATSNNGRVARVKIESIWSGPVLPTLVTVSGTPDQGGAATSVDRTFNVGQRYLFVPFSSTSPFQDNSCSPTQPYSSQLDALRPASAQPPAPGSDGLDPTGSPLTFWLWPGLAVLVIGASAAWMVLRRRGGHARGMSP